MRFKGFVGGAYKLRSVNVACERCLNLYYVILENATQNSEEIGYLTTTPGLSLLYTLPNIPVRGMYKASNNNVYAVGGNKLYLLAPVPVELGTLLTNTGYVSMADNGNILVIVDGPYGYVLDLTTNVFVQITDVDFVGSYFTCFINGYFVFIKPQTGQFYYSGVYTADFDPLDFQTAEGSPDDLLTLVPFQNELWLFGEETIEVFYTATAGDNAFIRNSSGFVEYGCIAPYSVVKLANTIFWLGKDRNGGGQIFLANGYLPQRVSTFAIEYAIQSYSVINDAIAFGYQQNGHNFYVISFPTANVTWVYDQTTNTWHERAYTDTNGQLNRIRPNFHVYANELNMVGDWQGGSIYFFDLENYTDNGATITRIRTSPHIQQGLKYIFYKNFELDAETGVGLQVAETDLGYDPQVALTWSDDGGHTWSNENYRSLGKVGEYGKRVIWRKLGRSRNRVWSIKVTDPVKVVIMGVEFDALQGQT